MFKKYRKLTAVVLSLALVITGIAFVPKTAKAAAAVIGTETTIGTDGWTYSFRGDTTTSANYSKGTTLEEGLEFTNVVKKAWEWDDLWVTSPEYTVPYSDTYTITLTYRNSSRCSSTCWAIVVNGDEVYTTWKAGDRTDWTPAEANQDTTYTYNLQLTKGQKVKVKHGQNWSSDGDKSYAVTFTSEHPAPTTTQEVTTTADPTVPQNVAAYNYYGNDQGYQVKFDEVTGANSYKVYMDNSAALATITQSGAFLPASTFSTYADDALHSLYVTSVTGGVESPKSSAASVRVLTKTSGGTDPTDIPRVYIVTNKGDNSTITKESKTPCSLTVVGGKDGVQTAFGDGSVKLRGNSTKFADKKAYNISFNEKKSLMSGRNKGKKWCLLAAAYDKSMMRTKLGMHLGEIFDNVAAPEDHYVEVYLNGTLMGLYDMCEPADNGRSDIDYDDSAQSDELMFELENGTDRDEIRDGAMYYYVPSSNVRYVTEDLEDEVLALVDSYTEDYNYNTYLAKLQTDLASNAKYANWTSTIKDADYAIRNYKSNKMFDYIDIDSFVDMYLVNEVMNTVDFNYSSVKYYIKNVNGQPKIFAGCIWDFDLSAGNSYYSEPRRYNQFRAQTNPWFMYLMRNEKFIAAVKARFAEKARAVINLYYSNVQEGYGTSYIDQMTNYIQAPLERNYKSKAQGGAGWDVGTPDSYDEYKDGHKWAYSYSCATEDNTANCAAPEGTVYANYTYANHITYLKTFLENHVQMFFDQWQVPPAAVLESDDLDITGYQMSATAGTTHDQIGFRNVFQFEPKVMGENIQTRGLVYGINYNNDLTADDVWVGNDQKTVTIGGQTVLAVQNFDCTDAGKLNYQAGDSKTADYYAQTMMNDSTVSSVMYKDVQFIVRAYVETEGGSYIYSKPYAYKYYDVADYLYQHNLFTNKLTHDTIYQSVLKAITPSYTEVDFDWGNIVVKP